MILIPMISSDFQSVPEIPGKIKGRIVPNTALNGNCCRLTRHQAITNYNNMSPEIIISIASAVVAISAVIVTIWQSTLMRRHNKLSVKPILNFQVQSVKSHGFIGMRLSNDGFGPAIIEEICLFIDNEFIGHSNFKTWMLVLKKLKIVNSGFVLHTITQNHSILSGRSINLIYLDKTKLTENSIKNFKLLRKHLHITVSYKSIYNEKFKHALKV